MKGKILSPLPVQPLCFTVAAKMWALNFLLLPCQPLTVMISLITDPNLLEPEIKITSFLLWVAALVMVFYPINIKVLNAYTMAHVGPHHTHTTLKGKERQKPKAVRDRSHGTVSHAHLCSAHTQIHIVACPYPQLTCTIINMWFFSFKDRSSMFPCQQRICPSIWWRLPGHERSQTLLGAASRWVTAAYDPPSSISGMCFPEYLVQWCFSLILTWRNDVGRRQVPRT